MSDTSMVLTGMTWLIANAILLSIAGFGSPIFELPSNPYHVETGTTTSSGIASTAFCATAVLLGGVGGAVTGAAVGFGVGGIVGASLGGIIVGSLLGCPVVRKAATFILNLLDIVLNFFGFLFDLLTFNVSRLPGWGNLLVVGPPGIALAFVALKTMNRAGG